ncbi:MAG: 16S rRNA (cytosine(1402)-N(4))-methyltransferase RsmH [Candidatus Edwardsbacteria bacterium]|nr:16S rRNA (cytosine(1402)-N(4))-methyltransferase RsmH [Candidatus Edwardsbacteria bacterium]
MLQSFLHRPVLLNQSIDHLAVQPGRNYLDGTLGGGGHSKRILEKSSPDGKLIGLDRDPAALKAARENMKIYGDRVLFFERNFSELAEVMADISFDIHGVLLDLGVSSPQIDRQERGFSFQADGPLDMRMGNSTLTAENIINQYGPEELKRIFLEYGQERFSGRIARAIAKAREISRITTTGQLASIIKSTRPEMPTKTLSRIFQAIRIEVNDELGSLKKGLQAALDILAPGGRLVVLTYHSLEDGMVKDLFRQAADPCTCPKGLPFCACGRKPAIKILNRKPVLPEDEEVLQNPRARSAHLRTAEKL